MEDKFRPAKQRTTSWLMRLTVFLETGVFYKLYAVSVKSIFRWAWIIFRYFFILIFLLNILLYSEFTANKIYEFRISNKLEAKASEIIPGDWDRICFLRSHKTKDLITALNRKISLYEMLLWNLRADLVDFDSDGGVIVYETKNIIQKLEHPGRQIFKNKFQGCYLYNKTYFKKNSRYLEIYTSK